MKVKVERIGGKPEMSILRDTLMAGPSNQHRQIKILQDILINPAIDLVTPPHAEEGLPNVSFFLLISLVFTFHLFKG